MCCPLQAPATVVNFPQDKIPGNAAAGGGLVGKAVLRLAQQHISPLLPGSPAPRPPPLDRFNALLSFTYTLLANDCAAALEGVGLDPYVGFLHRFLQVPAEIPGQQQRLDVGQQPPGQLFPQEGMGDDLPFALLPGGKKFPPNSVFECLLDAAQYALLKHKLEALIDKDNKNSFPGREKPKGRLTKRPKNPVRST